MNFALDIAEHITAEIESIIADVCPEATGRAMYGGRVFEREAGQHASMVCGHFIYKKHVSLEFSQGARLNDSHGVLEGKGKFRRHVKLTSVEEIAQKSVSELLQQAFSLD